MNPLDAKKMKKMVERSQQDPAWWCREVLGIRTLTWQGHLDVLQAMAMHDRVTVASGHCFAKGTKILMFDGSVKAVEDILLGELIMGDDSTARKVLKLSRGQEQMYKITYYDGTEYIHNESHILCLKGMSDHGTMKKGRIKEISIKDFLRLGSRHQRRYAGFYSSGVDFSEKSLPIPPYILGLWLGDGCESTADFASVDSEIIAEIERYALSLGCTLSCHKNGRNFRIKHGEPGKHKRGFTHPFLSLLRYLNLFKNKHIPSLYLYSSRKQRLELLAGLIDTDGSKSVGGGYDFIQKRKHLSEQVVFLARSLGVYARMVPKYVSTDFADGNHTEGIYWRVYIGAGLSDLPCRLSRKKPLVISGNRDLNTTGIRSVEPLSYGDYYGFQIDGNQRFLGADFMVLHNSLGKDFLSGLISLWFLYCFSPSVVITTAPTARQVEKIVWGEISKYWRGSKYPLGGRLLNQEIKIADDWYAIGFTTKDSHEMTGKFQGFKGRNILVVATEAQAIEDNIAEQIEGVLTSENSKLYLAGNPLISSGFFAKAFTDSSYKTFLWSCYDSPNYIAGKEVIPGMVGRKWVEDKEKRWGKDSPLFAARVLGRFPLQSVNSLISLSSLQSALDTPDDKIAKGYKVLAVDVARYGDDETVFYVVKGGKVIDKQVHQGKPTTQTEGKALALVRLHKPQYVVVDEGGIGGGVVDHLEASREELKKDDKINFEVISFNFGGKSSDNNYANAGTEAYFEICRRIDRDQDLQLLDDADTFAQLSGRKYEFDNKGKMILEAKEKIKKKGGISPDNADALIMALYVALDNYEKEADQDEEDYDEDEMQTRNERTSEELDSITGYVRAE